MWFHSKFYIPKKFRPMNINEQLKFNENPSWDIL